MTGYHIKAATLSFSVLMLSAVALGKPAALAQHSDTQAQVPPSAQAPEGQSPRTPSPPLIAPLRPNQNLRSANGVIRLFDSVLIYPLPDWTKLNSSKALQSSRYNRLQQPGIFALEAVPIEETHTNWKNQYALLAIQNFRGGPVRNMQLTERNFQEGCAAGTVRMVHGVAREGVPTLLVACGAYAAKADTGEVGVFVFLQRGQTAVRLYREWRGPAFDPDDSKTWPVNRAQLMKVFKQLQSARLTAQ